LNEILVGVSLYVRTEGRTDMMKLIGPIHDSANAPKKGLLP